MSSTAIMWAAAAPLSQTAMDEIRMRISTLEQRLAMNTADAERAADRLEVELRLAGELPSLDTAAFAAAQRQRLGALDHAREGVIEELTALKQRMAGTFTPAQG